MGARQPVVSNSLVIFVSFLSNGDVFSSITSGSEMSQCFNQNSTFVGAL